MRGIEALREYRCNKEKYLPMVAGAEKIYEDRIEYKETEDDVLWVEYNIGWNCGFIGKRPYFMELWAREGMTILTIYISTIGIEDYSVVDLEKMLIDEASIYGRKEGYSSPNPVPKFIDRNGNEFFSINVMVEVEDEPALIDGATVFPFSILNSFNSEDQDR